MPEGYPHGLVLTATDWPGEDEAPRPGDPEHFLPQGFMLGGPAVIWPYRGLPDDSYYGAQGRQGHPLRDAPLQEPSGGTAYFSSTRPETVDGLLRAIYSLSALKDYVAFAASSQDPVNDRYLDHLKIVPFGAITSIFRLALDPTPDAQSLTAAEAIVGFVAAQAAKWEEPGRTFSPKLRGAAGGDGDWAKESLAFGLHVENSYWGVCRVWSRAWLATK